MNLKSIVLPETYNYIACFLTLACNYDCRYCINLLHRGKRGAPRIISGREWVSSINKIRPSADIPVTLQGGEPSLHPDFLWIINNIDPEHPIDILTNLSFDVEKFIKLINPRRLTRKSPYASIRVSYHPQFMEIEELISRVLRMKEAGFSMGVYGILHPEFELLIREAQMKCRNVGIDFRTKEFLGEFEGVAFGKYRYSGAVSGRRIGSCICRTSELLLAPDGNIFKCHRDLYEGETPIGNILDDAFAINDVYHRCDRYGLCNPCDVKIKTNRFQEYGHVSVDIKEISCEV